MSPNTRQIVFINAAHTFTHYSLLVLPTAVLAMAVPGGRFGDSYGPILALATGGFVLYGAFALPQGWLAQRVGRPVLMTVFFFGTGLSMIATGFCGSPLTLAAAIGATGFFAAIYHPVGTAMLVDAAGAKPGRALGLNGVFGNIGVGLAPVVTAFLAGFAGWRTAFVVPGIVCAAVGLLWLRQPAPEAASRRVVHAFPDIPRHLVRRAVIVLLAIAVVSGLVFNAFTILLPKLIEERLGGDPHLLPLVGIGAFLTMLCGAATQFTVGRLIDRTTLKRIFLPISAVLVPSLVGVSYAQGWLVLPVAALVAASIFGQVTVNETMTARYISPALRTRMYSIRFFVGFLGAAAAAPMVAWLHERTGSLASATLMMAALGIVTLLCALAFPDRQEELHPELWGAVPAAAPAE
ncbi:MAG TPA: MFS transporter [Stellaceae bacterium]|jgi:MFS family permease|nr:MFS transporter [Stellaceae bacterium]